MIPRLIFLSVVLGLLYFLYRVVIALAKSGFCPNCEGQGSWKSTRGEKNHCEACNGSGKM